MHRYRGIAWVGSFALFATLLASVARVRSAAKAQPRFRSGNNGSPATSPQGAALSRKDSDMIWYSDIRRRSQVARGGWTRLQACGSAAMSPTAAGPNPSPVMAKAITKGKLGMVRFSIGTLKLASIVEYLRDNRSSR